MGPADGPEVAMHILPAGQLDLDSSLSKDEVLRRLAALVGRKRFTRDPSEAGRRPLQGQFEGDAFLVWPARRGIEWRRVKAAAAGVVEACSEGSHLAAHLGWAGLDRALLTFGLGLPLGVWVLLLALTAAGASTWSDAEVVLVGFPIMLAASVMITRMMWAASVRRLEAALRDAAGVPAESPAPRPRT
jgi:hypothetical protein